MSSTKIGTGAASAAYLDDEGYITTKTRKGDWLSKLVLYLMQGQPYIPKIKDIWIEKSSLCRKMIKYEEMEEEEFYKYYKNMQEVIQTDPTAFSDLPVLNRTLCNIQQKVYDLGLEQDLRWDLHEKNIMKSPKTHRIVLTDPIVTINVYEWGLRVTKRQHKIINDLVKNLGIEKRR